MSFDISNINTKRQKFGIIQLLLFGLIGIVFTVFGTSGFITSLVDNNWVKTKGEITSAVTDRDSDGEYMYRPIVTYKVNDKEYQVTSSIGSSIKPDIGGQQEVAYNPNNPDEAKVPGGLFWSLFILIFPAAGICAVLFAVISFIKSIKRAGQINQLSITGQKIHGMLVDIIPTGSINDISTYKINVAATDNTGTVRNYTSDTISGAAGLSMPSFQNTPIPIDVYIDPINTSSYYVDISCISELTQQRINELINSQQIEPQGVNF